MEKEICFFCRKTEDEVDLFLFFATNHIVRTMWVCSNCKPKEEEKAE